MFQFRAALGFLGTALLAASFPSTDLHAQSINASMPSCPTSTGEPGRLFAGFSDVFQIPDAFDRVESSNDIVIGQSIGTTPPSVYVVAREPGTAVIEFFNGSRLAHSCAVDVVSFDPTVHALSSTEQGDCDWQVDRELPLLTGIAHHATAPTKYSELAVADPQIAEVSPFTSRDFRVTGRSPGLTNVTMLGRNGILISQCPVVIEDAIEHFARNVIEVADLCRDIDGNPMRLQPGETVVYKREGDVRQSDPVWIADDEVMGPARQMSKTGTFELHAVGPGTTSLSDVQHGVRGVSHNCLIVVE